MHMKSCFSVTFQYVDLSFMPAPDMIIIIIAGFILKVLFTAIFKGNLTVKIKAKLINDMKASQDGEWAKKKIKFKLGWKT